MYLTLLFQNPGFFNEIGKRIDEGGPFAMWTILICFLVTIVLIIFAGIKLSQDHIFKKTLSLIHHIGLFALVSGLLFQFVGLLQLFDAIETWGNVSTELLAGGLKLTLLTIIFGTFTFLFGRLGIIILTALKK
ncbi:hypothetical protein [Zunongwangia endophytica]|uniref:MotA/TolQ/ExbB proton channel family protein n=1 Tax=Zunongwangia endophytica TaxID=1808945 RepID=A0ABV8HDC6_9FLAO|nr:hypothetical protein [Zunongwangia endophytica]MDN3593551.1 hypothetical protein [Zunongwangia endophytica]